MSALDNARAALAIGRDYMMSDREARLEEALEALLRECERVPADREVTHEWMALTTVASGPTAGRSIDAGPTDEATARMIASDPDPRFIRTLHRRIAAGPWMPVHTDGA